MNRIKEHYDKHLAHFYTWMSGDFTINQQEQEKFFIKNSIRPVINGIALDLGCGNGLQSISLARLNFKVTGIDFSEVLLKEVKERSKGLDIQFIEGDILNFSLYEPIKPELVICMGDTITHLHSKKEIQNLLVNLFHLIVKNGKIIISFRDLSSELKNENRFIPVRSEEHKIHTCFMEYFSDHVSVTDILHEKEHGQWVQKISSFKKLRISELELRDMLEESGFTITHTEVLKGMIYFISEKH
jgi:2-polyprenyl-3-methyl-5-hydroxy-6-metoxy-1,4-benzoquinol methylase